MLSNKGRKIKQILFYLSSVFVVVVIGFHYYGKIFAEQSGGSPESGVDSRITSMAATIATLGYGSTAPGSWGNYGPALNRLYSAAQGAFNDAVAKRTKNGSGTGSVLSPYTQALGGVDDYNNGQAIPADAYQRTWITCNSNNNYCGTGDNNAVKQDPNTGLVWSIRISSSANWFTANNCQQPSNGVAPTGPNPCSANGDVGCICTKLTSNKTGCEALGDGRWRLPYQKELMQAYIDGSWGNLPDAGNSYWSSTTGSNYAQGAWYTSQNNGTTYGYAKTTTFSVRCVR